MTRTTSGLTQAMLYLEILKRIPMKKSISGPDIRRSLEADGIKPSKLQLERALCALSEESSLGVVRNDKSKPYSYRLDKSSSLRHFRELTPQESLIFRLIERQLAYQLPSAVFKAIEPFFDNARETLSAKTHSAENNWLDKVAVVPNTIQLIPPKVKPRIFDTVSEALFEEKWLEVSYTNLGGETKEKKLVNPLAIVQQGERTYLVCQFETYRNFRHLALHRITSAKKTGLDAPRPADFSLNGYLKSRPFNHTVDDQVSYVHLSFDTTSRGAATELTESPLTADQTITPVGKNEKGEDVWHIDVPRYQDSRLLKGWLASWDFINVKMEPVDAPATEI